jgi:hypothetical protein
MSELTQTVSSYVRVRKTNEVIQQPEGMIPTQVLAGAAVIGLAIVYWQVAILLALIGGAVIGIRHGIPSRSSEAIQELIEATVAVAEKPKVKRHYQHRLKVTHYQTGKTVSV